MERENQKSALIEFSQGELLALELLYWAASIHPEDLVEIPRDQRSWLKNHVVASRYFDCCDFGIDCAAQEVYKMAKEKYIGRKYGISESESKK